MFAWIKGALGFIGSFFKRAARTAVGAAANSLEDMAVSVVREVQRKVPAEAGDLAKFDMAKQILKERYPNYKDAALNLAINLAVAVVKNEMEKNGQG